MCGIFGVALPQKSDLQVHDYTTLLTHRGPDDEGWLAWDRAEGTTNGRGAGNPAGHVLFGHRRLSILDLSSRGHQPMSTSDGRFHIVFNGEIYNYLEIRKELESEGVSFHSGSDTEVLLCAYARWGGDALIKLRGMFALAILDSEREVLFLARDPFGIKPLFYSFWKGGIAFSSELQPLLALPGVRRSVNSRRAYDYLRFGTTDHEGETLFSEISQLAAGYCYTLSIDSVTESEPVRYWSPAAKETPDIGFDESAETLRELFLDSIRLHLRSDVAVGAALSGGVDSSAIVCAIRHLEPDVDLHTFSFVAGDQALSEEKWVDVVAAHAGCTVHKVTPQADELVADLDELIRVQGEPFGSTSIYAQFRVFQLAHESGIKVMLDGQGADELMAGYSGYHGARLAGLLRKGRLIQGVKYLQHANDWPERGSGFVLKRAMQYFLPEALMPLAYKLAGRDLQPGWLNANWFRERGVEMSPVAELVQGKSLLTSELIRSITSRGLPSLLRYEDRNSMTHSIESRVPFLTTDLADFLLGLPDEYLISAGGESKSVFRAAMRGIVPDVVLDRRDKIGFATPEQAWLKLLAPWVEKVLAGSQHIPLLNAASVAGEWNNMMSGKRSFDWQIWRWLNFVRWVELFEVEFD